MRKLVSVVIPTYNYRRFVPEAIESVLAQTYSPIELIVVDDGSSDGTEAELERYRGRIVYRYQENRGLPAARNTGIREASGEFVAFLDADDLWAPTKIEKQMQVMDGSPRVGIVFCEVNNLDVRTGVSVVHPCGPHLRGDIRRRLLRRNCVSGSASAVLVRRDCFEAVGLFDEGLRSAEDWDMWIRLSRQFHFDYVAEPLVTCRIDGSNITGKIETMYRYELEVIQRALKDDPIDGKNPLQRHRSLAYVHFDAGGEYLQSRQYGRALNHLLHSVALWPFDYRHHVYLARALMRKPVVERTARREQ